jgi:hypothetical protein
MASGSFRAPQEIGHRASYSDRQNGGTAKSIADDHGIQ